MGEETSSEEQKRRTEGELPNVIFISLSRSIISLIAYAPNVTKRNLLGYVGSDSRDLKRVERDITDSVLSKEQAYLEISKLNNEQKSLNEKISRM